MPRFRALYTDYPWADSQLERDGLLAADCELIEAPDNREATQIAMAPGVDVIITCWAKVTAAVIDAADNCRHIARTGIGLDNINVARATERGILVTNVPDYCATEVAEHALALVFTCARKTAAYHLATKQGRYSLVAELPVERVSGQTLGILGLGRIGQVLADKALALGMRVVGTNRSGAAPPGVEWKPLEQLLEESDFVSVQLPLTPETRHLIGREAFVRMKSTAFLINTSRGGLVDHAALADALAANALAGAALDVQEPEPPDLSQPPWNDPRVIVTPHAAFQSTPATLELRTRVIRQVVDFLQGRQPEDVVNPEVLSG